MKEITDEHKKHLYSNEIKEGLHMCSTFISTYQQKLANIDSIITDVKDDSLKTPVGHDITVLKVMAKEAQESIARFEKVIQRLNKLGKFQE